MAVVCSCSRMLIYAHFTEGKFLHFIFTTLCPCLSQLFLTLNLLSGLTLCIVFCYQYWNILSWDVRFVMYLIYKQSLHVSNYIWHILKL